MQGVLSFFETMSTDGLSYNRLHSSALLLSLRLENYSEYFILSIALLHHDSKKCRQYSLCRRSLLPFSASLRLLCSASSAPVLGASFLRSLLRPIQSLSSRRVAPAPGLVTLFSSGRSCTRSSQSSSSFSGDASLIGGTPKFFCLIVHPI